MSTIKRVRTDAYRGQLVEVLTGGSIPPKPEHEVWALGHVVSVGRDRLRVRICSWGYPGSDFQNGAVYSIRIVDFNDRSQCRPGDILDRLVREV